MSSWDPEVYLRFAGERTRPAADLLSRVPLPAPSRVVDLGCGPGNSTALLAARYPTAELIGLDSSPQMIAAAEASGVRARFILGDFDTWTAADAAADLIFANAAFQWSSDPVALALRLYQGLPESGVLAFQVPLNFAEPSHTTIRAIAANGPWADHMTGVRPYDPGFARADGYARPLLAAGARLDVWTTTYLHVLSGPDPVFRWLSGTEIGRAHV